MWFTHRARQFLLGRRFKLVSDHRPLEFIFDCNKELPKVTSAKMLRWALQMTAFEFDINYKKGETIPHADALSRLSFLSQDEENNQETLIHLVELDIVNLEHIMKETESDRLLMDISRFKLEAWWPGYCQDVEEHVKNCEKCAEIKVKNEATVHAWPSEHIPWCRVYMDHASIQDAGLFLILVDAFSEWPKVIKINNCEVFTVKTVFQSVFSRNGVPEVLVSDNAAEFHDTTLCQWVKKIGCLSHHIIYHLQPNGAAERKVKSIKIGLKAYSLDKG